MFRFTLALFVSGSLVAADKPSVRRALANKICTTRTIDFEGFSAGDTPSNLGNGVSLVGSARKGGFPAMIFDTANPTGEDPDLATDDLGKVLIISEDGDSSDPDDAAEGGTFLFSFDHPVEITDVGVLDASKGYMLGTKESGQSIQKKIPLGKDNVNQVLQYQKKEITEFMIHFQGGGAVSFIEYVDCSSGGGFVAPEPTPAPTPGGKSGGSGGDPHFKRWNGRRFFFHGECDLMLLHSDTFADDMGLDLHIRTTHRDMYSYIEAAALRIGDSVLEVSPTLLMLDGRDITNEDLPLDMSGFTISASDDTERNRAVYTVNLNNGDSISFRVYKFLLSIDIDGNTASDFGDSVGLLGDYETGDMLGRDGLTVMEDPEDFGMEWQVRADEPKLFLDMEREPQLPHATCGLPATDHRRKLETFTAKQRAEASEACAGKSNDDFDFCVSDVLLTGDIGMAGAW